MGQAAIKSEAVTAAEKAIDRALAAKKRCANTPTETTIIRPKTGIYQCAHPYSRYFGLNTHRAANPRADRYGLCQGPDFGSPDPVGWWLGHGCHISSW